MVVCKFFLEGRCKFGDGCRFDHFTQGDYRAQQNKYQWANQNTHHIEHQRQGGFNQGGSQFTGNQPGFQNRFSVLQQPSLVPPTSAQQGAHKVTPTTVVNVVKEEATQAERGGQWPFSCFAPFKRPNLPGFIDLSPEELRFQAYQANASNNSSTYLNQVAEVKADYDQKRHALQNPDGNLINYLVRYERGENVFPTGSVLSRPPPASLLQQQINQQGSVPNAFSFKLPSQTPAAPPPNFQFSAAAAASAPLPAAPQTEFRFALPTAGASQPGAPAEVRASTFGMNPATAPQQPPPAQFVPPVNHPANATVKGSLYSLMEDLSSEDQQQYKAVKFTIGKIPFRPPAMELCK